MCHINPIGMFVFSVALGFAMSVLMLTSASAQVGRPTSDEPVPGTQVLGGVNTWSMLNRPNQEFYYFPFITSLNRVTRDISYRANPTKLLDERGPQLPEAYSMSNLSVLAAAKGDWQVGIEYEIETPGFVMVTVMSAGAEPFQYRLSASTPGRHQETFKIPSRMGAASVPAIYSLRAFSDAPGEVKPLFLRVYRIAAGPTVNDSSNVDHFRSNPGVIHPQTKEKAVYDFHSVSEAAKAESEIRAVARRGPHLISIQVHNSKVKDGIRPDQWVSDDWDGKNLDGKISIGVHQVAVRSWSRMKGGGAWSVSWSKEFIYVQ